MRTLQKGQIMTLCSPTMLEMQNISAKINENFYVRTNFSDLYEIKGECTHYKILQAREGRVWWSGGKLTKCEIIIILRLWWAYNYIWSQQVWTYCGHGRHWRIWTKWPTEDYYKTWPKWTPKADLASGILTSKAFLGQNKFNKSIKFIKVILSLTVMEHELPKTLW